MLPDLVTVVVPAPTIKTVSVVASLPVKRTPAVPFVDPVPVRSYVVSLSLILAQVLSPRRKVVELGVPVAESDAVSVLVASVPDSAKLTNVLFAVVY